MDYRADFYALGILFYQILCKRRPFNYVDSLELIHAHIAIKPVEPKQIVPNIPDPINRIIIKLMSKNAEDRYQSEAGVIKDLKRCLDQWKSKGQLEDFQIGQDDQSNILILSELMYGREDELNIIFDKYKRLQNGQSGFILVTGYSGIGKMRLISEIRKPVFENNGYFGSGKFDEHDLHHFQFQQYISHIALLSPCIPLLVSLQFLL